MYQKLNIAYCRIHIKETDDIKKIWILKMEAGNMIIYKAELIYESLQCGKNDKETLNPEIDDKKLSALLMMLTMILGFAAAWMTT